MKIITAKELKNRTGEALRLVSKGEKVLVTRRGKPFAYISPFTEDEFALKPFEQAWKDIEKALERTEPHFESWRGAMRWVRKRV
jgi:prevent-host-death family protein